MALCPSGHESQTSDYCDTCGAVIGGAPPAPVEEPALSVLRAPAVEPTGAQAGTAGEAGGSPCPECGAARGGRFCEECGYDFELAALVSPLSSPPPATPDVPVTVELPVLEPSWSGPGEGDDERRSSQEAATEAAAVASCPALALIAAADPEYYAAQVRRGDIVEDDYPFPKYPQELRFALVGDKVRIGRSSASRGIAVEVDLAASPVDPAISHLHAQLLRAADGSWLLVDLNSANGTRINGADDPVPAETEIPVAAGDRIHVGVWTTLSITPA